MLKLRNTPDRLRWYRDICALYRRHGIGLASWDYKSRYFGLLNEAGVVDEELLAILRPQGGSGS